MIRGTTLCEALEPRMLFAHPTFTVSFSDPGGANASYYTALRANVLAAAADWGQHFTSSAQIDIAIDFTTSDIRSTGSSQAQRYLGQDGALGVYQAGAATKLTSGIDVNGSSPDIVINLGETYLSNELWFDPDPVHRTAVVPANKTDAYSVLLHEIGHGLGINGYRDGFDGTISGFAETTYDQRTAFDGLNTYFIGPTATNWNWAKVPLTYGNVSHVGNDFPRPGTELVPDLMNGVVFNRGVRYDISGLDLAILQDTGLTPTLFPWSNITGQVFFDSNHNGVTNRREPGLAGWSVYADLNGNGLPDVTEPVAITDSAGTFTFSGLHAGRYVLRAFGKHRWALTTPAVGYVVVRPTAGKAIAAVPFGFYSTLGPPSAAKGKATVLATAPMYWSPSVRGPVNEGGDFLSATDSLLRSNNEPLSDRAA